MLSAAIRGVATGPRGVYRYLYPQKSAQVNFLWGKNDVRTAIQQFYTPPQKKKTYTPQNKFLATPLAAIKRQYSSVLPLLCQCFGSFCRTAGFCIFIMQATLIVIANTALDRSAASVLSVINWTYCTCTGIWQIWLEIWPEPELDLAGFPKNVRILGLPEPEPKSGTILRHGQYV